MKEDAEEFYRLVAEARNPERLFSIRSNKHCGFYAGLLPNTMQILIGRIRAEKILALFFCKSGEVYDVQRKKLPAFRQAPEEPHLDVNDAEFHKYLRDEFGFESGVVRVRQFLVADDDCGFWVGPLPWHFNQFLNAPEEYTAEEQSNYRESIRQILEREECVLDWGNDWWVLEADGTEAGWDLPMDRS